MKNIKIGFFSLLVICFSCEDFLSGPLLDQNPNEVDDVSIVSPEALLVGSQVTIYGIMEGYLNRAVSMVMQQMSGLQTDYYRDYNCDPIDVNTNGRWTAMYGTGGLIDLTTTQEVADEQEKYVLLAISQMWEALLFSTAADLWGDIPYSQAAELCMVHLFLRGAFGFNLLYRIQTIWEQENCLWTCLKEIMTVVSIFIF